MFASSIGKKLEENGSGVGAVGGIGKDKTAKAKRTNKKKKKGKKAKWSFGRQHFGTPATAKQDAQKDENPAKPTPFTTSTLENAQNPSKIIRVCAPRF